MLFQKAEIDNSMSVIFIRAWAALISVGYAVHCHEQTSKSNVSLVGYYERLRDESRRAAAASAFP